MSTSFSEISTYRRCRRLHDWKYNERYRPKQPAMNFFLGRGVHKALEKWYSIGADPIEVFTQWAEKRKEEILEENSGLFSDQIDEIDENIELGQGMVSHYQTWAQENDPPYFVEVIDTEVEFTIDIPGSDIQLHGYMDALVRDKWDIVWVHETKTTSQLDSKDLDLNEQPRLYTYAANDILDDEVEGVIWTELLKNLPTQPKVNKDGSLSKRKVRSTEAHYKQALIDHYGGEDEVPWDEYKDMLQYYNEQEQREGNPFFHRERIRVNDHELDNLMERTAQTAKEIEMDLPAIPNPGFHCKWCDFAEPCKSKDRGEDFEWLLDQNFEKRS